MNKTAEDVLQKYETCYAYNDFGFYYKEAMPRHECQKFVDDGNQCKGGHWEVRRKADFESDFNLRRLELSESYFDLRKRHLI